MRKIQSGFMNFFPFLLKAAILALFLIFGASFAALASNAEDSHGKTGEPAVIEESAEDAKTPAEAGEAEMSASSSQESFSSRMFEDTPDSIEQPTYPGVANKLLEKGAAGEPVIKLYYPAFGNSMVDSAIKSWLEQRLAYYESLVKEAGEPDEDTPQRDNWEMTGFYTLERPRPDIASMLFNIYAYTGGAHGNLWLYSLNYNLANGQQLNFENLFGNPQKALELLSSISIDKLRLAIGEDTDDEWLERGAGPEMENFSVLTLMTDGLFVEFQPYQVGPWAIGPQRVFITLNELKDAMPSETVWKLPAATNESAPSEKKDADEKNEES